MSLADESMALRTVTMEDKEDTNKLFDRLKLVEVRYNTPNHKVKEEDNVAVVLSQAPKQYQVVLTTEHRAKGNAVATADLEDALKEHYRMLIKGKLEEEDEWISSTAFDGDCFNCGKPGHRKKYATD